MTTSLFPTAPPEIILPAIVACIFALGALVTGLRRTFVSRDVVERLAYYACGAVAILGWVGALLAAANAFIPAVVGAALVIAAGARFLLAPRRGLRPSAIAPASHGERTPPLVQVVALLLLVGAGCLYARPAETYNLADDSAVYTIGGIVLAREGSLFHEPQRIYDFAALMPEAASESVPSWETYEDFVQQFSFSELGSFALTRHVGPFYQWSLGQDSQEIGFLPFPKVWVALVTWAFGPSRAVWAAPMFGVLSLLFLYGLVRRSFGWRAALGSVALLSVGLPQVWYARYMLSEVFAQAVILGALYMASLARDNARHSGRGAGELATCSALLLGSLAILRFEWPLMVAPFAGLILALPVLQGETHRWTSTWLRVLIAALVLGVVITLVVSPLYLATRSVSLLSISQVRLAILLLGIAVAALVVLSRWLDTSQITGWLERAASRAGLLAAVPWILWLVASALSLMTSGLSGSFTGWLIQYLTWPTCLLGFAGALLLCHGVPRSRDGILAVYVLFVAGCFGLLFTLKPLVMPVHPWAMRRSVPLILPALAVGAAAGAAELATRGLAWGRRADIPRVARSAIVVLPSLLVVGAAVSALGPALPFTTYQERGGLYEALHGWAASLPDGAVLLFGQSATGERLTQPLEMVFGHPSFVLQDTGALRSESVVTDHLVRSALQGGRSVYYVLTDGSASWRPQQWRFEPAGQWKVEVPVLRYALGRPPTAADIGETSWLLDTYRVVSAHSVHGLTDRLEVDAGEGNGPYFYSGFYGPELDAHGEPFRWTNGDARITIPWPHDLLEDYADICVRLDLSGWRPEGVSPAHLVVDVESVRAYDAYLDASVARQALLVPVRAIRNGNMADLEIRLRTDTWNQARLPEQSEDRALGIIFYAVSIERFADCP